MVGLHFDRPGWDRSLARRFVVRDSSHKTTEGKGGGDDGRTKYKEEKKTG